MIWIPILAVILPLVAIVAIAGMAEDVRFRALEDIVNHPRIRRQGRCWIVRRVWWRVRYWFQRRSK